MPAPVSIIIPAFNQIEYCRQCIDSIHANTDPDDYQLVLVNNGSDDGVAEYFDSIADAKVIHSDTNRGFAGGVNLGLANAQGHALLLNSDTIVPRDWLSRLVDALGSDDNIGIVGPMSNYVSGEQMIPDLNLTTIDEINAISDRLYKEQRGEYVVTDRLVGFCMLIRDSAWKDVGDFDEGFGIGNYEDDDYGLRVRTAGFELRIANDCFVFHFGSRTFAGMGVHGDRWDDLCEQNEERFRTKWNVDPDHDRSAARDAARVLNRDARLALKEGQRESALALLTDAIRTSPELVENYNDLGVVLWEMGETRRAIAFFRSAIALNPDYLEANENLAAALKATDGSIDSSPLSRSTH
jgi:glycosyltransferase involved in cell wall biosynthesis